MSMSKHGVILLLAVFACAPSDATAACLPATGCADGCSDCAMTGPPPRRTAWGRLCCCLHGYPASRCPSREALHFCAQCDAWSCKHWWRSSCDMPQRLHYKLTEDGYYAFRPYHYASISSHQQFVRQWGGDERNPYSHEIFDQLDSEELPLLEPELEK